MTDRKSHFDTRAVHAGGERGRFGGAVIAPIFRSTLFEQSDAADYHDILYPRLSTLPDQRRLGRAIAELEGAEAGLATASGMAAIATTLLTALAGGGHLLAHRALYGGTHHLVTRDLPALGVRCTMIDATDPASWPAALAPETRAIYVEAATNPLLEIADHEAVVAFARAHRLVAIIDGTFVPPTNFRPLDLGYDIVLHSATKYLNGHSDVVAGAIAADARWISRIKERLDHLGGCLDPQAGYLLSRGLKTLALRVARQNDNALAMAEHLERHPAVARVHYPGLASHPHHHRARKLFRGCGGMLAFELAGGASAAARFCGATRLVTHSASLGGVESLVTRPAVTSHRGLSGEERARLGISDALVRMSAGIEHAADLIDDVDAALAAAA